MLAGVLIVEGRMIQRENVVFVMDVVTQARRWGGCRCYAKQKECGMWDLVDS